MKLAASRRSWNALHSFPGSTFRLVGRVYPFQHPFAHFTSPIVDPTFLGDRLQNGSPYAIGPLSVCLPVCLSCLSVMLLYCGQTVARIRMRHSMEIGLGPGHTGLDGDAVPTLKRGTGPNFRPMSVVTKRLDGSSWYLVRR